MRYAWDNAELYLTQANISKGFKGYASRAVINYLRKWDLKTASRPDFLIANSEFIAGKIKRIYNRNSDVIYPPVDVDKFELISEKNNYYLTASRMVPYKRVDLIVEAFLKMNDKKLLVVGDGPELNKIKSKASANIEILGYMDNKKLKSLMQGAKAFVFAAEEDFGITVVEAMACGTPVIAFNKGGTAETVIDGVTGILFDSQTPESIKNAIKEFEKRIDNFDLQAIRKHSEKFSRPIFEKNISEFVMDKLSNFNN
jgi:glycosyltransferase involved in cell wall biosynthesis